MGLIIDADTAATLADLMARNVTESYGAGRFPNMDLCAKSGTAEVGGGKAPTSWFTGFLRNEDAPTPSPWWWRRGAAAPARRAMWPPRC